MKFSESWLREWVNPKLSKEELCNTLTMAGLEVEELSPAAETFNKVIVSKILSVKKHPSAENLKICEVAVNDKETLKIVCGATNVKIGMRAPLALNDAVLPDHIEVSTTTIRGEVSEGMLCSSRELGLSDDHSGLLELPQDAPIGADLWDYLQLGDYTIDVAITPNRGDCLSIKGMAREVAALTSSPLKKLQIEPIKPDVEDVFPIHVEMKQDCPHYVGRVIRQIKTDIKTPTWLQERLRRSGIRSIHPIVDVTNYVMLELGQPMHAFDLNTLKNGILVRQSQAGEKLVLLDGSEQTLDEQTLVIADHEKPLAIAGVMGGMDSSVTLLTQDVFLESAYFSPRTIAKQRQHYALNSDSAFRFERGIDPTIQIEAIERATEIILAICDGKAGPLIEFKHQEDLPEEVLVPFSLDKVKDILGVEITTSEVESIFERLGFKTKLVKKDVLEVTIPPYRSDITLPEDLMEEIARLFGYNNIPTHSLRANIEANHKDTSQDLFSIRQTLINSCYNEIISYSFVDQKKQLLLNPDESPYELLNPISADMAVMRTNLWPGLINTLLYNKSRQQNRVRLFEIGTCFTKKDHYLLQRKKLAGLITGLVYEEQWGINGRKADFFDLKGDIEKILCLFKTGGEFVFQQDKHPALHPGQTAAIFYNGQKIGLLGKLHPQNLEAFDLTDDVFLFELELESLPLKQEYHIDEISKFPEIRRDIAILVNEAIPSKDIQDTIKRSAGDWLKEVFIFDVYQGKGVAPGLKSIALALIWQHPLRTLVDDEIVGLMEDVIRILKDQLGATLRS